MAGEIFAGLGKIFVCSEGLGPMRLQILRANVVRNGGDLALIPDSNVAIIAANNSLSKESLQKVVDQCGGGASVSCVDVRWILSCVLAKKFVEPTVGNWQLIATQPSCNEGFEAESLEGAPRNSKRSRRSDSDDEAQNPNSVLDADGGSSTSFENGTFKTTNLEGVVVGAIGLGTLPMNVEYPDKAMKPAAHDAVHLIHSAAAVCSRCALFVDTADTYCVGPGDLHSGEKIVRTALEELESKGSSFSLVVGSKGGMSRISSASNGWRPANCSFESVKKSIRASADALGCGPNKRPLFLWQLHHVDALVKTSGMLEDVIRAAGEMRAEGFLLHIGLCNASCQAIQIAIKTTCRILSVQNEYSFWKRDAEMPLPAGAAVSSKKGVLAACEARNLVFIAHSPLGGLNARRGTATLAGDFPACVKVAAARGGGCSAYGVYLAYLLLRAHR